MKRTHKIVAGLLLAAGIGSVTLAQAYGPGGGQPGAMPMGRHAALHADPAQRAEQRLNHLKDQLKITAAQEPLWQAYEQKVKAEAGKGLQARQALAGDASLSAPERMAKKQNLLQERVNAMAGANASFNRLYEALTPEQKKVADQYAAQTAAGAKKGMGGSRMGPGRMMPPSPQG